MSDVLLSISFKPASILLPDMPASMRSRVPPNETYVQFPAEPEASGQNIIFTIVYKPLTNEYNENTR